jgi:para-nitrobenzyl esterase
MFRGGDGAVLRPDDASRYTFTFEPEGVFTARIDCNRARGGWKSPAPGRLEFGPMAATRAACPPGSMHDQIMRQLPFVRSYVVKDGRLYLSLMADGGTYELTASR